MHIGGSSPFNKKEWVKNGQCAIGLSLFLLFCLSRDKQHTVLKLGIFCNLFPGSSSHPDCHSSNTHLLARDSSEWDELNVANKGIFSCSVCSWITPNAHMTRDSDNLLPIFCQIHIYSSRICTMTLERSDVRLNIAFKSDSIKNYFLLEQ